MLCFINWQVITNSLEKHTAFIFKVQPQMSHFSVCYEQSCYIKHSVPSVHWLLCHTACTTDILQNCIRDTKALFKYVFMSHGKAQKVHLFQHSYLAHTTYERQNSHALQVANTLTVCLILVFQIRLLILYKSSWK
jgi:hypothetical protein